MASFLYYKFRSQISYSTITFDGHFISVGEAKKLIAAKQGLPEGAAEELVLTNAQAGSEYKDDTEQVPKGTSITVRRVPAGAAHRGKLRPLVGATQAPAGTSTTQPAAASKAAQQPAAGTAAATDVDEFGGDPLKKQAEALKAAQEEAARQAAATAAAQRATQAAASSGNRDGPGRGMQHGGRGGRGSRTPYPNYICPRCTALGQHWESDCPTQNDPAYDVKRVRAPAGLPKGKIAVNPDGDYLLADGTLGQIATNSAAYRAMAAQMLGLPPEAEATAAEPSAGQALALPAPQGQQPLAIEAGPGQVPSQQAAPQPQAGTAQQAASPLPQLSPMRTAQPAASSQPTQPPPSPGPTAASMPPQQPTLSQPTQLQQQQPASTSQPAQQPQLQPQPASSQPAQQPPIAPAAAAQPAPPSTAAPTQPAATTAGLFDDDEDVLQAATQQVKLMADTSAVAPNEASAAVGPLHAAEPTGSAGTVSKRSASPALSEGEMQIRAERAAIPSELRKPVFQSVHDFLDRLPLFVDELPAASVKLLVKAFGAGLPLTPTEFKQLQESERKAQQKADSGAPQHSSRLGRGREEGGRDRERGRSREDRDGGRRGRRSSRSRSHSPRGRSRSKDYGKGRSRRARNEEHSPVTHVSRSNRGSKDGKAQQAAEPAQGKGSSKGATKDSKPPSKDSRAAKDSKAEKRDTKTASKDTKATPTKPASTHAATVKKAATTSKAPGIAAAEEQVTTKAVPDAAAVKQHVSAGSEQQPVKAEDTKQGEDVEQQEQGAGVVAVLREGAGADTAAEAAARSPAASHDAARDKEPERSASPHHVDSPQQPVSSGASRGSQPNEELADASVHDAAVGGDEGGSSEGEAGAEKLTPSKRKASSKSRDEHKHKKQKKSKKHKEKDKSKDKKDASKSKRRSHHASKERAASPAASASDHDEPHRKPSRSRSRSRKRTRSPSPVRRSNRDRGHASPSRSPCRSPARERAMPCAKSPAAAPATRTAAAAAAPQRQAAAEPERPPTRAAVPSRLLGRLASKSLQDALQPHGGNAGRKRRPDVGALPIHGRMGADTDEDDDVQPRTSKDGRWVHDKFAEQQDSGDGSTRAKRQRG